MFFYNPTWKMKLVPVGFDPDRIERHCYGADTIPLSRWRYCTYGPSMRVALSTWPLEDWIILIILLCGSRNKMPVFL